MLRIQKHVNTISDIIHKTQIYGRELNIIGKYSQINIITNIKNYLDMLCDRNELSREELIIIIKEFNKYLNFELLEEYYDKTYSLLSDNEFKQFEKLNKNNSD